MWARVCTSPNPMMDPLAYLFDTMGDQYGWSMSPMEPGGMPFTRSSKTASGAIPRFSASMPSRWPNSSLNQVTIQKPRWMKSSMSQQPGRAAGQVKNRKALSLRYFLVKISMQVAVP